MLRQPYSARSDASDKGEQVTTARGSRTFVTFPWRVYYNDPNWVPL
jgi:hypothetical protein